MKLLTKMQLFKKKNKMELNKKKSNTVNEVLQDEELRLLQTDSPQTEIPKSLTDLKNKDEDIDLILNTSKLQSDVKNTTEITKKNILMKLSFIDLFYKFKNSIITFIKLDWTTYIGFFLVSLAVLSFEVIINRMFALMFWYHFAFLVVSIALFGIGVGSMLVYFLNTFFKKDVPIILAFLTIGLAFLIPYSLLKINMIPLNMELFTKDETQMKYFIQVFLTLSIPFALSGFIFSFVFTNHKNDITRIYFFDLVGGGVGCIFSLLIFPGRGPLQTAYIISLIVMIAAAAFTFKRNKLLALILLPILIGFQYYYFYPKTKNTEIRVSKGVSKFEIDKTTGKIIYPPAFLENYPTREYSFWDNFGFVAVHKQSDNFMSITSDYSCYTHLLRVKNNKYITIRDFYYPYLLINKPDTVGIIGVGAGKDVGMALAVGAKNIYGAEFNKTIYNIYDHIYSNFIGNPSQQPNVHIRPIEGRFFIRSSQQKYNILVFDNAIAQTAVSSGAFTISESYLYTVEAMMDYIQHLQPGGLLFFSNPYVDADRFTTDIREAFKRLNRADEFKNCLYICYNMDKTYNKCKVLVKNGSYTTEEINKLLKFSEEKGDTVLYAPGKKINSHINQLVMTDDIEKEYQTSQIEIRPSIDDWPFFTQRVKEGMTETTLTKKILEVNHFYPEPFLLLQKAAKSVGLYSIIFLILPLLLLNLSGFTALKNKLGSILYFMSLGLGFMMIEIVLMQKYMLILGHPIYAFSIVLAGLLVSSGIGSLISEKIKNPYNAIIIGLLGIIISIGIFFLFSKYLSEYVVGLSFKNRIIITILLISLNGFFMGFMMPSGIRIVSRVEESIPWMWSINSVFSVAASFLAIYLSIIYGFTLVLWVAAGIYVIGSIAMIVVRNK